jgi:hypothetical protein
MLRPSARSRLLEPRGAGAQVRGDGRATGGEQAHHLPGDALDAAADEPEGLVVAIAQDQAASDAGHLQE